MFSADTKFLVVDDFGTMRKIIKKILGEIGFTNIVEAEDGKTAFSLVQDAEKNGQQFGCIISDWNMPNMTGLEFLKLCKSDVKLKSLPFILVTAESEQAQIIEAAKSGVSDYVIKPFNAVTFKEKLQKTYNKHYQSTSKAA
jgi:two-component system chemotaxis response regulator CheY